MRPRLFAGEIYIGYNMDMAIEYIASMRPRLFAGEIEQAQARLLQRLPLQ